MEAFRLTFAKVIKHDPFFAEVIVDEGTVITMNMVDEYHRWITEHLSAPSYLLINRLNCYRFSPAAEREIGNLEQIKSVAVVSYDEATIQHTQQLKSNNQGHWKLRQFGNVSDAMTWLY